MKYNVSEKRGVSELREDSKQRGGSRLRGFVKKAAVIGLASAVLCAGAGSVYAASYNGEMLSEGMTSDSVAYVQELLTAAGYPLYVDGYYGSKTTQAVLLFQIMNGLYPDGMAGPATVGVLESVTGITGSTPAPQETQPEPAQPADTSSQSASTGESLSVGSYGDSVVRVQQALSDLGYSIYVDGDYGVKTADVVSQFQRDNGLYVDGVAGPKTQGVLFSGNAHRGQSQSSDTSSNTNSNESSNSGSSVNTSSINLRVGSVGEDVKMVQNALHELGYYNGLIDGEYGRVTAEAVKAFQERNDLYVDGEAGPKTAAVLFGSSPRPSSSGTNVVEEDLPPVRKAARNVLDRVGWDLYNAYAWTVHLAHVRENTAYNVADGAMYAFNTGAGDCIAKAASFCMMARELGFTCNVIWGKVPYRAGGYGDHAWAEIVVNGATYVCDPEFEYEEGRNGYMINYGQSGTWKYVKESVWYN